MVKLNQVILIMAKLNQDELNEAKIFMAKLNYTR